MSLYTKKGFIFNHMPKIIIKVDDLRGMTPKMKRFVDWCSKKNIPLCLGLIGVSLENPSKNYLV